MECGHVTGPKKIKYEHLRRKVLPISMECLKRGLLSAQVKTIAGQYENLSDYKDDPDFIHDQAYFTSKWQPLLPASIYPNDNFK